MEEGDEGVPVLGLVVGAVDEDEMVGLRHGCGVLFPFYINGLLAGVIED